MAEERLTPHQVDCVLWSIEREACETAGISWAHDDDISRQEAADYGNELRAQWEDERSGVCLCGCLMTRHLYVTVARHYCRVCDALCRGGAYQGSGLPVK